MGSAILTRTTFAMPRAAEYFSVQELRAMTGQQPSRFGAVVLKELLDNAIDAAEHEQALKAYAETGTTPVVHVGWQPELDEEVGTLTVVDNGVGIPPATVMSILDFATRTSDKAIYRSPTRGAQGNAFKTILGISYALGIRAPVVVEAKGVRHSITVDVDPAGTVHVHPEVRAVATHPGTRVTVPLPHDAVEPTHWGRAFTLFNPHISVNICQDVHEELPCSLTDRRCGDFYHATVAFPGAWRKYLPNDHTSAWWYSREDLERLVFAKINASAQGQEPDRLLRDFVMEFRGLTGTSKAKAVCARVPGVTRLSDFASHKDAIRILYTAMRTTATAPSADVLGTIGAAHFEHWFTQWYGVKRFWYDRQAVMSEGGLPCTIEIAVAETVDGGDLWTGLNFSPTFDAPLAQTWLESPKVTAFGLTGFLRDAHAMPGDQSGPATAVALHIVCPALEFTDRGKTRFEAPRWMADPIALALWKTTKTLYADEEKRTKDAAKARRQADARAAQEERARRAEMPQEMSLKDAVFLVMQAAWEHSTGQGVYRVSKRNLYYAVRDRIQAHTSQPLEAKYFTHTLLPAYEREHGALPGVYAESRGVFHEPHSGVQVILDDAAVAAYVFPDWRFDKILYIPTVCSSVASRNLLLYQSLPLIIPYRYALLRRRKDDIGVGTAARGIVA